MNKRLQEIMERKTKIRSALQSDKELKKEEMDAFEAELRLLNDEQEMIEQRARIAEDIEAGHIVGGEVKKPAEKREHSSLDSVEYRQAFMEYVTKGTAIPAEFRADANTLTTDIGAVIPPVILNQIIEKITAYGMVLPLVNRTNYKTGLTIPTSNIKPVATWVAEGKGSNKQKKVVGSITFNHYKLRCAVSASVESEYMSLSAFETTLISNIAEAMAVAVETAIISGTGSGQPTGILNDTAAGQTINVSKVDYKTLVSAEAALPLEYEAGAVWCMGKKSFMEFVGMTDTAGQPIARVNYGIGGIPERTLLGRRVVLTNYLPAYATTLKKADVFAFLYNFKDYTLNTNFQIGVTTYEDHDTDDIIRKTILVCDGKPIITNSLVKLTGSATA